ncbi:hypothetical protein Patl1_00396 [Pistacia atlantica]|uniref:Uncharacterized protein n=1 Tax=Pistacia atlantica TaxID=434234 RepID=A0ACC1CAI1_9ROSI|nr:hypothetical protein Patl1_00396 [Pistacia atlantica]
MRFLASVNTIICPCMLELSIRNYSHNYHLVIKFRSKRRYYINEIKNHLKDN